MPLSFRLALLFAAALLVAGSQSADARAPRQQAAHAQPLRFPDEIERPDVPQRAPRAISKPKSGTAATPGGSASVRPAAPLWTTLGPLALVIGLILVAAKLWKRHSPLAAAGLPPEALEILGRRAIDARQSILLVRLGSKILVLGSSVTGLQTLSEITDPVEIDLLAGLCRRPPAEPGVANSVRSLFGLSAAPQSKTLRARRVTTPGEQKFADRLRQMTAEQTPAGTEDAHAA